MARSHGLSRQQFARRFCAAAGLPPKLFARITRFQALVQVLLSTDVSRWASVSPAVGFYDQAHMINEFRAFAGSPPTVFFRPHDGDIDPAKIELRGRPSEWLRPPRSVEQLEERVVVSEILEHDIRAARPQLFDREPARRDADRDGAGCARTGDVVRGVADHEDLVAGDLR